MWVITDPIVTLDARDVVIRNNNRIKEIKGK